jgi:secreted trypsin-like serine protease
MNHLAKFEVSILLISALSSCLNPSAVSHFKPMIINGKDPFTQSQKGSDQAVWVGELAIEKGAMIATCTGTLFDYKGSEYMLSAAHCFIDKQGKVVPPGVVTVFFYDHKTGEQSSYKVSKLSVNPYYDRAILWTPESFKQRDLAILKLSKKVDQRISINLPTLVVNSKSLRSLGIPGGDFAFYGFGLTNGGELSTKLLYGLGQAIWRNQCIDFIAGTGTIKEPPRPPAAGESIGIFCSLTPESGAYTARGDSGGPAIVYRNSKSYLVGILASGSSSPQNPSKLIDSVFESLDDSKTLAWLHMFTSPPKVSRGCLPFL